MNPSSNPNAALTIGGPIVLKSYAQLQTFADSLDETFNLETYSEPDFNCYIGNDSMVGFQAFGAILTDSFFTTENKRMRFLEFADFSNDGHLSALYVRAVDSNYSLSGTTGLTLAGIYEQHIIPRSEMDNSQLYRASCVASRIDTLMAHILESRK